MKDLRRSSALHDRQREPVFDVLKAAPYGCVLSCPRHDGTCCKVNPQSSQACCAAGRGGRRLDSRSSAILLLGLDAAPISVAAPGCPAGDRPTNRGSSGSGSDPGSLRTGADTWMRQALSSLGPRRPLASPALALLDPAQLAGRELLWLEILARNPGRHGHREHGLGRRAAGHQSTDRLRVLLPGADEPALLAISPGGAEPSISSLIGYLGAGVYEETLFRLILVPVFFGALRLLQMPQVLASTGRHRLGVAVCPGPPRRQPRRGVHLVRVRLPLDGRRLFRLGVRPAGLRDCRGDAHDVRHPGRLDRLAFLTSFRLSPNDRSSNCPHGNRIGGGNPRRPKPAGPASPSMRRCHCASFISPTSTSGNTRSTRCGS